MQVNIVGGNRSIGELAETLTQAAILGPDAVEEFWRGISLFNEFPRMVELFNAFTMLVPIIERLTPKPEVQE